MLCKKYNDLGHFEKVIYIGELLHSCQCDDELFDMGKKLIEKARQKGTLDGVVILPDKNLEESENLTTFAQ